MRLLRGRTFVGGTSLTMLGIGGCVGTVAIITPTPVSAPELAMRNEVARDLPTPVLPPPPEPVDLPPDELMSSRVLDDSEFESEVRRWVDYWTVTAAPWFPEFLSGMARFETTVDSVLAERRLPASLRYLPLIESGYNPRASSRASAVGLWQFMEPTARVFGMSVTPLVDDRRNPLKSTDAATRFLIDLHADFGSWFWALAAYNAGPTRTRRILRAHAPLVPRTDSLFWALRGHFPQETRDFIPKLIAAVRVASRPHDFGYHAPDPQPFSFDEVRVPDATTLDVVARAAGATEAEIAALNPEYLRGMTPPGESVVLRVPPGLGPTFEASYVRIPPSERVTFVEHLVSEGETLSHIAHRYGVRVAEIQAANPGTRTLYLRVGSLLVVPVAPSVRRVSGSQ